MTRRADLLAVSVRLSMLQDRDSAALLQKLKQRLNLQSTIFVYAPQGLRPPAQGYRFGYPGNEVEKDSTATRLRNFLLKCRPWAQPRCG